jgi:DNA (cytosine-5)-methyltransferase 1
MKTKKLLIGELFCGPGGLASGAFDAKLNIDNCKWSVEHCWASDKDENACKSYALNFCGTADLEKVESVICNDIKKLAEENFFELENIAKKKVASQGRNVSSAPIGLLDIIAFGFPCNDFSLVGERKGINGSYGPLYSFGVQALDWFKPSAFIAENVGGITSSNNGEAFKRILRELKNAGNGYNLTAHLYRFEEYGVPQKRHRIIIVGIDRKAYPTMSFRVPKPTHETHNSAGEALIGIIAGDISFKNNEKTSQSQRVIERLQHTKPGENAWTASLPPHLKLNVKGAKLSQIYKRLKFDEPAYTITGSGGGGTHVYHWDEPRALTNRERARLQTFKDDFVFIGSKEQVRKQIGMAVPCLGSKIIFEALLKTLANKSYESVVASLPSSFDSFFNQSCLPSL